MIADPNPRMDYDMLESVKARTSPKLPFPKPTTRVTFRLVYIDFWSMMKFWFCWSLLGGAVTILVTFLLWSVLDQSGALASIDTLMNGILGNGTFNIKDVASLGQVLSFITVASLLNVVIITALAALSAVLYNLTVAVSGGLTLGFTPHPNGGTASTTKGRGVGLDYTSKAKFFRVGNVSR